MADTEGLISLVPQSSGIIAFRPRTAQRLPMTSVYHDCSGFDDWTSRTMNEKDQIHCLPTLNGAIRKHRWKPSIIMINPFIPERCVPAKAWSTQSGKWSRTAQHRDHDRNRSTLWTSLIAKNVTTSKCK